MSAHTSSPLLPARLLTGAPCSAWLLGSRNGRGTRRSPVSRYQLGSPGAPSPVPTLLIAVFDNSGSVVAPAGTDPLSNRFTEVEQAFSTVARRAARHELGAVLHFDSPTRGDAAPVPLTRHGLEHLRAGLAVPPDGAGSSELRPSLRRAADLAEAHPEHATTLVVLSDFLLMDTDPTAALAELAAFPGEVHAVVLGSYVSADAFDGCITVTHVRRDDSPGAVARAVFSSLVAHRPGSRVLPVR